MSMLGMLLVTLAQGPPLEPSEELEQVYVPVLQLAQAGHAQRRPAEEQRLWLPRPSQELPPKFPLAVEDSGWSVWTDHLGEWALSKGRRIRIRGINMVTGETLLWFLPPWGQRGNANEFQRAAVVAGCNLTVNWSPHFQGFVVHRSHQQMQHYDLLSLDGEVEEIGVRSGFPADALFLGESTRDGQLRFQFTHGNALWRLGPNYEPRVSALVQDLPGGKTGDEPRGRRTILAGWCLEPDGNVVLASANFSSTTNSGWNQREIHFTRIDGMDGTQLGSLALPPGSGKSSAHLLLAGTESSLLVLEPSLRLHVLPRDFQGSEPASPPIPMTYTQLPTGRLAGAVVLHRLPKAGIRSTMLLLRD